MNLSVVVCLPEALFPPPGNNTPSEAKGLILTFLSTESPR